MKVKQIIEKLTEGTWVRLEIKEFGMIFATKHTVNFYKDDPDGEYVPLLEKTVDSMAV